MARWRPRCHGWKCTCTLVLLWAQKLRTWAAMIEPECAVAGVAAEFKVKGTKYPYVTCETTFYGNHGQAVFGSFSSSNSSSDAVCVVAADTSRVKGKKATTDAVMKVTEAPGPRSDVQSVSVFKLKFFRAPRVQTAWVEYKNSSKYGRIVVELSSAEGMLETGTELKELLRLSIDLVVLQRSVMTLELEEVVSHNSYAHTYFAIPEFLPSGEYPCVLSVSGSALTHTPTDTESGPTTRSTDSFNDSDSAQAAPLIASAQEYTFMLTVDLPEVRLAPSKMDLGDILCKHSESEDCTNGNLDSPGLQLIRDLKDNVNYEAAALLAVYAAETPESSVSDAITRKKKEPAGGFEGSSTFKLPVPEFGRHSDNAVSFLWVNWDRYTPEMRLMHLTTEDTPLREAGYIVRVVAAVGAVISTEQQSVVTAVPSMLPDYVPRFHTSGQQVIFRGDDLMFKINRTGPPSSLESVVMWRIVNLDPPDSSEGASPWNTLSGLQPANIFQKSIHKESSLGAAVHSNDTVVWAANDTSPSKDVRVKINWSAVPYTARWMLAVRLSFLRNGVLYTTDFTHQTGSSPPPTMSPPPTGVLDVLTPSVPGNTELQAKTTNALLYGVTSNSCPPGTHRTAPGPPQPPLPEVLEPQALQSISLQITHPAQPANVSWMPSMPPFNASATEYELMVPHGSSPPNLTLATTSSSRYTVAGCGYRMPVQAPHTFRTPSRSNTKQGTVRVLAWPLQQPLASRCIALVFECPATSASNCTRSTAAATYMVRVVWLQDPSLAQISGIDVTVGSEAAVPVCQAALASEDSTDPCPQGARVQPGANSTHPQCSVGKCTAHGWLSAAVTYYSGEAIRISVAPAASETVGAITIGQRVFRAPISGAMGSVAVTFTLFDSSDRLSPFVPFFILNRTRTRAVLDVPITITLNDGRTSSAFHLLLDIKVLHMQRKPMPHAPHKVSVSVVTESASVTVVKSNRTDSGSKTSPADSGGRKSRSLLDLSSSAPHGQRWLRDPLQNSICTQCQEGMFSYSMDSMCQMCQPGTCAPKVGMAECALCPKGAYTAIYGASSCSPCVQGSYAQLAGSPACRLCPFGFTTSSDGASVCDEVIKQTVSIGTEYALAVSLSVRVTETNYEDVHLRTGILGPTDEILQLLVSLDSASAFRVSTSDVEVSSITEIETRQLRINFTTNIGMDVPHHANKRQLEEAVTFANLSKDAGIGNLTWTHTSQALGARVETEDFIKIEVREPDFQKGPPWQAVVFPLVAGLVIIGSALLLKVQRPSGPLQAVAQVPSAILACLCVTFNRHSLGDHHSHMSDVSSDFGFECGSAMEINLRTGNSTTVKQCSDSAVELSCENGHDARKRTNCDTCLR